VLACLLEHGACAWLPDQEQGLSALDYARVRNRQGCLALLRRHIQAGPPPLKEVGPLVASFFEAPVEREWMAWALDYYGPAKLLDARASGWRWRGREDETEGLLALCSDGPIVLPD
jgi:hypothetical protein